MSRAEENKVSQTLVAKVLFALKVDMICPKSRQPHDYVAMVRRSITRFRRYKIVVDVFLYFKSIFFRDKFNSFP